jgi:hypothetical protein
VNTLKNQDFIFIVDDPSVLQEVERQLTKVDAATAKWLPWAMRPLGYIYGVPGSVQTFMSRCMTIKTEASDASAAERCSLT